MPSHIFTALGMWNRSIEKNLPLAARSYHALLWLAYGHLQQDRYEAARTTLGIVDEALQEQDAGTHRAHFVRMRAAHLVDTESWADPHHRGGGRPLRAPPARCGHRSFHDGLARAAVQTGDTKTDKETAEALRTIWDEADAPVKEVMQTALSVR